MHDLAWRELGRDGAIMGGDPRGTRTGGSYNGTRPERGVSRTRTGGSYNGRKPERGVIIGKEEIRGGEAGKGGSLARGVMQQRG